MLLTLVERLARFMAILGGLVLTALIGLTCVSVLGRGLNTFGHSEFLTSLSESAANALIATGVGPVSGDFELVEVDSDFDSAGPLAPGALSHSHFIRHMP